eukprot:scaffold47535_cov46-Prasinocladus_malaysianus.AAC.1
MMHAHEWAEYFKWFIHLFLVCTLQCCQDGERRVQRGSPERMRQPAVGGDAAGGHSVHLDRGGAGRLGGLNVQAVEVRCFPLLFPIVLARCACLEASALHLGTW